MNFRSILHISLSDKSTAASVNGLRAVRKTSLSDSIVEQITGLIAAGSLRPGQRMPSEKDLCQQFGVGRTSVREALRSLSVMGILDTRAGEGTYVSGTSRRYFEKTAQWALLLDPKLIDDLIETRLTLECQTAFLAARRGTRKHLAAIDAEIEGMRSSIAEPERYLEHDLRFHLAVAAAGRNSILENLLSMTRQYLQAWIKQTLAGAALSDTRRRAELSIREHRRILSALEARDAARARQAMRLHILSSSRDLRR